MRSEFSPDSASSSLCDHGHHERLVLPPAPSVGEIMDAANWAALLAAIPPVDPDREGVTPLSWYHGALRSSCGAAVADPGGNRRNPARQQEDADLVTLPADSLQKKKRNTTPL